MLTVLNPLRHKHPESSLHKPNGHGCLKELLLFAARTTRSISMGLYTHYGDKAWGAVTANQVAHAAVFVTQTHCVFCNVGAACSYLHNFIIKLFKKWQIMPWRSTALLFRCGQATQAVRSVPQPLRIHFFNNRPTLQYFNNSLYCNVKSINSTSRTCNMMGNNLISSPASHKRLVFCDANASGDSEPFKAQCLLYVPPV